MKDSMKQKLNKIAVVLLMLILCISVLPAYKTNAKEPVRDLKKVKVGYYTLKCYHEMYPDGTLRGYGYELLQKVAPYAGFEYEYVGYGKTYEEMLGMLERGEIDILTSARRTPELGSRFLFSKRTTGNISIIITARKDNDAVETGNPRSLNGMRVGMVTGDSDGGIFISYAEGAGITYYPQYFATDTEMAESLGKGEIDLAVSSNLRDVQPFEKIVENMNTQPLFAITRFDNAEMMNRFDSALAVMDIDSPAWRGVLYSKYFSDEMGTEILLSAEEKSYIEKVNAGQPIKMIMNPDCAPYSYVEDGVYKGILVDIYTDESLSFGMSYEILPCNNTQEYYERIKNGDADVIIDSTMSEYQAELLGYNLTDAAFSENYAVLCRKNSGEFKSVAMVKGAMQVNPFFRQLIGGKSVYEFDTMEQCVEAVKDGTADCSYMYYYSAANYVIEDYTGRLESSPIHGAPLVYTIAVKKGTGKALYSLMNKKANNITDRFVTDFIEKNRSSDTLNFRSFIYRNPILVVSLAILFLLLGGFLVFEIMLSKKEKQKQHELAVAFEEVKKANSAKSQFLSNMSHDIRTPMNAIMGMTQIAMDNKEDNNKVGDCLNKIKAASGHLLSLINDVLDMSKLETGERVFTEESVDVYEVFDTCLVMIEAQAKSMGVNVSVDVNKKPEARFIYTSALHLRQVLINLASNGIKYNKEGGSLKLTFDEKKLDDNRVELSFRFADTGIGIDPEYLNKIFDPFTQEQSGARTTYKGTGLGLSIVKGIVEQMGGSISVESEKNVGSTFTAVIPFRIDIQRMEEAKAEAAPVEIDYNGLKVLIVEDNPLNLEIAKYILEDAGAQPDSAENGQIAVEKLKEKPAGTYDLILMDIMMPVMDGYEATRNIRGLEDKEKANIPIVAMTANAFKEDVDKCMAAGMNAHVAKPVETEIFFGTLTKVLSKKN